ncbi:ABC-type dipeptide/oligopeptide/nickel transport system ATPase component [Bradyrhizobium barranii subsp. barranii]
MSVELLGINDLHVSFSTRRGMVEAVRGVTLTVAKGEMLGLVGESGSGKSVTGFATTRLLDAAGRVTGGKILFRGQDVTKLRGDDLRQLQGAAMSMIFQNPRAALNPIRAIGLQIADAILTHKKISKDAARAEALELLRAVQIRDPETRMNAYPHELSGGMCQRVMIAIAISCNPALLIADEPTTGLDVTTQKVVMDLLADIAAARGMATILITHDLGLAARYCRRIAVMERGRIVEEASPKKLFSAPQHAYTRRLVAASPTATSRIEDLVTEEERERHATIVSKPRQEIPHGTPPLLEVRKLAKRFDQGSAAVADFSMTMAGGESVGLVGESGSGKSTTSRMICRLIDPSEGDIVFDGQSIGHVASRDFSPFALAQRHPDGLPGPEREPQPALRGVRLHRPSPDAARRHACRRYVAQAGGGMRGAGGLAARSAAALSAPTLRRPESPRRHCPRHCLPAAAAGVGRADRRARRLGAGGGAAIARPSQARERHCAAVRQPRSQCRAHALRPHHRAAQWRHRGAGGEPGAVRQSQDRLHAQAGRGDSAYRDRAGTGGRALTPDPVEIPTRCRWRRPG